MKLLIWLRHFWVPHHTNNHRAKILHPSVISILVALLLVYQFGINFALLLQPSILGYASNIPPERVIELTNQERAKHGLSPLNHNLTLSQAAQLKAGDMFAFDYWAHTSPSGRDPWGFFKDAGYTYLYAGENLARDFQNPEAVVQAWMNSPSHRENILNDRYQEIGLVVVDGTLDGVETTLVVQLFGTPTPAPPSVPVEASAIAPALPTATPTLAAVVESLFSEPVELPKPTPTVWLTPTPTPTLAPAQEPLPLGLPPTNLLQSKGGVTQASWLSPFNLTKVISVLLLGGLVSALALDVLWVYRKKIVRLSGKNVAHLIFIGALLLSVILMNPGAIL
ncbi:CAP domain-containing protein [Patescibacteria group bacterium]